jgi:hypothetical protein
LLTDSIVALGIVTVSILAGLFISSTHKIPASPEAFEKRERASLVRRSFGASSSLLLGQCCSARNQSRPGDPAGPPRPRQSSYASAAFATAFQLRPILASRGLPGRSRTVIGSPLTFHVALPRWLPLLVRSVCSPIPTNALESTGP